MEETIDGMRKRLKRKLDSGRYEHTLGVSATCVGGAMCYGEDLHRAQVAGLLHDCAKYGSDEKKLESAEKFHLEITDSERKNPSLLHAKLGAYLAEKRYGIEDAEILSAIACHTTGKPEMTRLEKIVFVADYIEPGRDRAPRLGELRMLAFHNLDQCVYEILADTLRFLKGKKAVLDPTTEQVYQYYKQLIEDQQH